MKDRTSPLARAGRRAARFLVVAACAAWIPLAVAGPPLVNVFKSATCGCCSGWIEHLRAAGFEVRSYDLGTDELIGVKSRYGVEPGIQSCHTAVVDGYVVEGHVPADVIRRLLAERPPVVGISAPGMPPASPGMNIPGGGPYDVVSYDAAGRVSVYAHIP